MMMRWSGLVHIRSLNTYVYALGILMQCNDPSIPSQNNDRFGLGTVKATGEPRKIKEGRRTVPPGRSG